MADAEVIMLAADMLDATGVRYELKVGHLALMKNLLSVSNPPTSGKSGHILTSGITTDSKRPSQPWENRTSPVSLISLVECRTLAGGIRNCRGGPRQGADRTDSCSPGCVWCEILAELRDCPGARLLYRHGL